MFKDYAKYYDLFYLNRKPYERDCKMIYDWANSPKRMLDVCCGTANYWKYFPTEKIYGIEISKDMIEQSCFESQILQGDVMKINMKLFPIVDCVTALFNAINYLPEHHWWKKLPQEKGGFFIFDIWSMEKIAKEGFTTTTCRIGNVDRMIEPFISTTNNKMVIMKITVKDGNRMVTESHPMYLYSDDDVNKFCGDSYRIADKKETDVWHVWYKLERV